MKPKTTALIVLIIFLLIAPMPTFSQAPVQPRPPEPKKEEEFAPVAKGLKTKILEIKNRDPEALINVLRGLGSGEKGTQLVSNREFQTITVRDYPENIAVIEKALSRLDQPEPTPISLEIKLHLIAASRTSTEKSPLPAGLEAVIAQLQSTLQYSGYRFITTSLNRVKDGGRLETKGYTDPIFPIQGSKARPSYSYFLGNIKLTSDASGKETIQIRNFSFNVETPMIVGMSGDGSPFIQTVTIRINTELSLREGEMVVVGTANVGSSDEAIIVVVSIKKVL